MEVREALEKAAATSAEPDTSSSTPAPEPVETTATPTPETASGPDAPSPAASTRARDEHGRFAPKPADAAAEKVAAAPKAGANGAAASAPPAAEGPAGVAAPPTATPAEPVSPKPVDKAPQSWTFAEREAWAKGDAEGIKKAAARREREIQTKLNEVAQTTKTVDEFRSVSAPYEAMFRSLGLSSTQAFDVMAKTFYTIENGPVPAKAQTLATIIKRSGVPIEALAAALDGQPAQSQPVVDPRQIAQQAKEEIRRELAQQAAQVSAQRNQARLSKFAEGHEFYEDVRTAMADILVARGVNEPSDKDLEEVYDLACRVHPEISGYMRQKDAAKAAQSSQASTQRTLAAASSVRSTPAAAPGRTAQPKSIREAMEAAAEATSFGR